MLLARTLSVDALLHLLDDVLARLDLRLVLLKPARLELVTSFAKAKTDRERETETRDFLSHSYGMTRFDKESLQEPARQGVSDFVRTVANSTSNNSNDSLRFGSVFKS